MHQLLGTEPGHNCRVEARPIVDMDLTGSGLPQTGCL
jgi:hypothetical protein